MEPQGLIKLTFSDMQKVINIKSKTITIQLGKTDKNLNLGYGISKPVDEITSSIDIVYSDRLEKSSLNNPLESLYGELSGLMVLQNAGTPWDLATPFSTWHGVETDASGCVTNVVLNNNNLTGTITNPSLQAKKKTEVDILKIIAVSPTFVELRIPLPALKKISILDVATTDEAGALSDACQWAAKRCDVAMWCTKGYVPAEQAIWAQMPDLIKDHAFLMLTHADQIAAAGKLDIAMTAVRKAAGDEFNHVLPIATLDALASRSADGSVDKEKMRASGGTALIGAVLKQVDQGRQAFVDLGDILLHQNAEILAGNEKVVLSQPVEDDTPTDLAPNHTVELSVVHSAVVSPVETADSASSRPASAVVTLHPATRSAYETALSYIAEHSQSMAQIVSNAGDGAPAEIIARASEHVQWICDYLNENGDDSDLALQRARDTSFDAADLAQLMQMEKNDNAAVEALSLLLQIKHELQADLAA